MSKKVSSVQLLIILFIILGIFDTTYLTYKHFFQPLGTCFTGIFGNCGEVLHSQYSIMFGVPVALLGLIHYLWLGYMLWMSLVFARRLYYRFVFIQTAIGLVFSLYFTLLQIYVIKALCLYCLASALISLSLYILVRKAWYQEYHLFILVKIAIMYKLFAKPISKIKN